MINLIKNEFNKIFNNRLYICMVIIIVFVFCTNLLYKYKIDENGNIKTKVNYKKEQEIYEEKIENCINCSPDTIEKYKYIIEKNRIKNKYGSNSWQSYVFDNVLDFNDKSYINRFENNDWKSFVHDEIKKNIENEKYIETLKYRLDNNISYGYNYLNAALDNYANNDDLNGINKYIMDTKYNINKVNDLRGILINFFNEYGIIIVIVFLIIFGGIITEEYNKGTIKQLLILPTTRTKILFSKYITMILSLLLICIFTFLLQLLVGSIIFGTCSLKIPVLLVNNKMQIYSIYKYLFITILSKIPILILLPVIIIFMNVTVNNVIITVLFTFILYTSSKILLAYSTMQIIKIFVNVHWDLSIYLTQQLSSMEVKTSIYLLIIYLLLLGTLSIKRFNNIDIKNSV